MAFDPTVNTFTQVTNKLKRISDHLEKLSRFMQSVDWSTVARIELDDGGSEPGNNPPKWPPR